MEEPLAALVQMSNLLGDPSLDLAILAEGNTSCQDSPSIWVKASGRALSNANSDDFVRCDPRPLLEGVANGGDDHTASSLLALSVGEQQVRPSVEAFMHAWLLSLEDVRWVGHVHPTAALAILCSGSAEELCAKRFFPDDVVCCGPATAWVPYTDPGLALARAIRESVLAFEARWGQIPRLLWMENHGVTALGRTPAEVTSAILMNDKLCRMIAAAGGAKNLRPLPPSVVERIAGRQDEHHRQSRLFGLGGGREPSVLDGRGGSAE